MRITQAVPRFCYTRFNSLPVIASVYLSPDSKINKPLNHLLGFKSYDERVGHFDRFNSSYSNTRKSLEGIILGNGVFALSGSLYPHLSPLFIPATLGLFLSVFRTGLAGHLLIKQTDIMASWLFGSSRLLRFAGKYMALSSFVLASYKLQNFFITESVIKNSEFDVFPRLDFLERLVLMSRISFGACFFGLGLFLALVPIARFLGVRDIYKDIYGE
ncbi:hypothetical protein A2276_02395 [candidate division WOR-1 bacterium RIFOXYA12_FULL_43_27]|uniref:Uncharacterized protein n=1 Tax=candidate division WOR-1 bacterium RIFOXYC2_FULL_46_14 TaxID=1802587 RepID=A0A1F4U7W3_UNCSA|nr:MAG: hypothetical protein A2276_02395 [candidate division WOR-1 bacterium RIFOXYA12_FULL_43_27]OGC19439.1 MAG: hypothetical protein A2292_01935 [candidate division WOR-1 bacterium RIFOXYB2_FULL_46_45]OGC30428.1 MAG: hypothetical protein A2232_01935 [candidate division WOR-1 bacterium RIFOXYA2_FULL_46_56]OGC41028.1 MAG: hypothetical protein A2438_01935 [candidate division WOR-1 bacterium RIFOXYC2_FULL_46_14]